MRAILKRYKQMRKARYFKSFPKGAYAFVGIGNHSLNILMPILQYLHIDLKYIVTHSNDSCKLINDNMLHVKGTTQFDEVLKDPEIKGIFISASPNIHFKLVKKCLEAGKSVFVEKPVCSTLAELNILIALQEKTKTFCMIGFQKRYAPTTTILKGIKKVSNYTYHYQTGRYPEGNSMLDLFIHPLSLVTYLFGDIVEKQQMYSNNSRTQLLHFKHKNGIIGSLEFSSDYSWQRAEEQLVVNTERAIYRLKNSETLIKEKKPLAIVGIPLEKVFKSPVVQKILYERNNFNPILENNQLLSAGYYSELKTFIDFTNGKKAENLNSLIQCKNIYQIIETITQ